MKSGQSTGGIEQSPRYRRKKAAEKRAEEARWKSLNGPVVSYVRPPVDDAQGSDRAAGDTSE